MKFTQRVQQLPPYLFVEISRRIAAKRCVVKVRPSKIYSWDHNKLGGVY